MRCLEYLLHLLGEAKKHTKPELSLCSLCPLCSLCSLCSLWLELPFLG